MRYKASLFTRKPIMAKQSLPPHPSTHEVTPSVALPTGTVSSGPNSTVMHRQGFTLYAKSHLTRTSARGNVIPLVMETVNQGPLSFDQ